MTSRASWAGRAVRLTPELLDATYQQLRACGQHRRECHLYWIASWCDPNRVIRLAHPRHNATVVSVEVDMAWMNALFLELAVRKECVRAQVHSHPGSAFHSGTDNRWPAVGVSGFLSLVIPHFGAGASNLAAAFLAERDAAGGWNSVALEDRIVLDGGAK